MPTTKPTDCETRLLNTVQAAELLGVKPATLRAYRVARTGPRYVKLNGTGAVRYDLEDIRAWIEAHKEPRR